MRTHCDNDLKLYQLYRRHDHTVLGFLRQYVGGRPMGRHDNRDGREATLVSSTDRNLTLIIVTYLYLALYGCEWCEQLKTYHDMIFMIFIFSRLMQEGRFHRWLCNTPTPTTANKLRWMQWQTEDLSKLSMHEMNGIVNIYHYYTWRRLDEFDEIFLTLIYSTLLLCIMCWIRWQLICGYITYMWTVLIDCIK